MHSLPNPRAAVAFALAAVFLATSASPLSAQGIDRRISLDECIQLALENNLDLQVSRFDPQISQTEVEREMAQFDSSLTSNTFQLDQEQPAFAAGQLSTQDLTRQTLTFRDSLVTGMTYDLEVQTFETEGTFLTNVGLALVEFPFGPVFDASVTLNFEQPLLRNRGAQVNRTLIHVARNNQNISESRFHQKVIDTLKSVEESYWELVFSIRDLEVRRKSLTRARRFLEENRVKVEVGTLAPIEITTAEAEVASRMEEVIVGENSQEDAQDNLRVLISSMKRPIWEETLIPIDRPPFVEAAIDLQAELDRAYGNRPDLVEQRLKIENEEATLRSRRNQNKYDLALVGSLASNGQVDQASLSQMNQGFSDSWSQVGNLDFVTWSAGVNLTIPFSNRDAKSQYAAARLRRERELLNHELLQLQATQEVRRAARQIATDSQRVQAARVNVRLQREKLDAEEKKYENGMSTSFQVLEFQEDLAEAERSEVRALIDYNVSLAELDRVTGTLAGNRGIVVE